MSSGNLAVIDAERLPVNCEIRSSLLWRIGEDNRNLVSRREIWRYINDSSIYSAKRQPTPLTTTTINNYNHSDATSLMLHELNRGRHQSRFKSAITFIHSFILNIYIAPLQDNYSEALPTPARLKRAVLS